MAKHQRILYVFGLQPRGYISQPPFCVCPDEITIDSMKKLGVFQLIGGTVYTY